MNPDMVSVVCGAGKRLATAVLVTEIRPFTRVCTDVYFTDV